MYRPRRKALAIALVLAALGLHFVTVVLYTRQPDRFAAFTLFPIWIWGGVGILVASTAFVLFRAPLALFTSAVWALTILLMADESKAFGRIGMEELKPGTPERYGGREVTRIATINWSGSERNFSEDIKRFKPDIIFIQEIPHPIRFVCSTTNSMEGAGTTATTHALAVAWWCAVRSNTTCRIPSCAVSMSAC